jgi:hypothetical protein
MRRATGAAVQLLASRRTPHKVLFVIFRRTIVRKAVACILGLLLAFAGGVLATWAVFSSRSPERVTLVSPSPDDKTRVRRVELPHLIDRNFELRIENVDAPGNVRAVFRSPDEGRPEGSERVLWSGDGRKFILLGRHFYVESSAALPSGEQLYLLFDLDTGELRCNATQSNAPRVTLDQARALGGAAGGI